ncbi:pyrroloquinoline-quinone synthase PqqC [soil metagenome]
MDSLLSADEFVSKLRQIGAENYHDKHPFQIRMHAGTLSKQELRGWLLNRFYYQQNIPIKDALILSKLPTQEDRRRWISRIVDHDGTTPSSGGIESWLSLGEAAGLSRQAMLSNDSVLPGVCFAVDAYVNFCRLEHWYPAVASSLTELFAPDLVARRIEIIEKHYPWVNPQGLEYFRKRLEQAPRDADHALELVLKYGHDRTTQNQAFKALTFKCEVLWSLLDGIEKAYSQTDANNIQAEISA